MAAPITTETILHEDGAAAALAKFGAEVRSGEDALRNYIASAEPGKVWTFRELRDSAAGNIRKTAMGVALMSLDKVGVVRIDYARSTVVAVS